MSTAHSYIAMAAALVFTFCMGRLVTVLFNKKFKSSKLILNVNPTQYTFLKHLIIAVIYFVGIGISLYMLPPFRNLSLSLFASSGVIAVVVGFASQHALGNIISGIFIVLFKPFAVDDRIRLPGKEVQGVVEDITLRHTIIRTFENKRIVVPNSLISTEIIENANLEEQKICEFVEIGISYDADLDKAMKIIQEECLNHKDVLDIRNAEEIKKNDPVVPVRVIGFGDSSVNLRAWVWFPDPPTGYLASCELRKCIKNRFDAEGIEIPFPHRTVVYKENGRVK